MGVQDRVLKLYPVDFVVTNHAVHKNNEWDPSEANRNRLVAKRNDICGNITS